MFNIIKTRRGKLKDKLERSFLNKTIGPNDIELILTMADEYQKDNLDTISKLKREKLIDTRKINGALRQTINVHGPITKVLIGSASKRILGALLSNKKNTKHIYKMRYIILLILLITIILIWI